HHPFVRLHALALTFHHVDVDDDGVARRELGHGFAEAGNLFLFQGIDDIHFRMLHERCGCGPCTRARRIALCRPRGDPLQCYCALLPSSSTCSLKYSLSRMLSSSLIPLAASRSGRLSQVRPRPCLRLQRAIAEWSPLSSTGGTEWPS